MNGVTTRMSGVTILRKKVVGDHFCRVFVDLLTSKKDCTNLLLGSCHTYLCQTTGSFLLVALFSFGVCCFRIFSSLLAVMNLLLFYESEFQFECRKSKKWPSSSFVIVRANIVLVVFRGGVSFSKPTPNHQITPTCRSLFEIYQLTAVSHIWTSHLFHPQWPTPTQGMGNWGGVNLHGWSQVQGF